MHPVNLTAATLAAIQAGAEYVGIAAAGEVGGPVSRIRAMLDAMIFWVRTHPLHLVLGVIGVVVLRRLVFRRPRF